MLGANAAMTDHFSHVVRWQQHRFRTDWRVRALWLLELVGFFAPLVAGGFLLAAMIRPWLHL